MIITDLGDVSCGSTTQAGSGEPLDDPEMGEKYEDQKTLRAAGFWH